MDPKQPTFLGKIPKNPAKKYQKKHQKKYPPQTQPKKIYQKGQYIQIPLAVANFNVLNHLHLNKYTKFQENIDISIERYIYSIKIVLNYVNMFQIFAVSLSEVTLEYYTAFNSLLKSAIRKGNIKVFYDGKSLMTIFFKNPRIQVIKAEQVSMERDPQRDRLQIFNLQLLFQNKYYPLTYINIHGYGLPEIREKYLYNTFILIDELRHDQLINNDLLCTGDFNSDWDQVFKVLENVKNENYLIDVSLFENFQPTSYHRYILDEHGQFNDKPSQLWYSKLDHLLFSQRFQVVNLSIVPNNFTYYEHPYQIIDDIQYTGQWPSDHTLNIYNLFWSPGQ